MLRMQCEQWARAGECDKNPPYMQGAGGGQGACRLACKACVVCKGPKDAECIKKNRISGGYANFEKSVSAWLLLGQQRWIGAPGGWW